MSPHRAVDGHRSLRLHLVLERCQCHVFDDARGQQLEEAPNLAFGLHHHLALAALHAFPDEARAFLDAHRIVFLQAAGASGLAGRVVAAIADLGGDHAGVFSFSDSLSSKNSNGDSVSSINAFVG